MEPELVAILAVLRDAADCIEKTGVVAGLQAAREILVRWTMDEHPDDLRLHDMRVVVHGLHEIAEVRRS